MGLFGKLFEKKECSICGGEIGLLGNRKLEDGNMCKKCAAKLSPFFSERRHSTVDQINEQLAYREKNQEALKGFRPVRSFGENEHMIVEEINSVPTRFVLCDGDDYEKQNADLISFKDVTDCSIQIAHTDYELTRTNDENKQVSYEPPRYKHNYNFRVKLQIENNPYFDEISFKLNEDTVEIVTDVPEKRFDRLSHDLSFDPMFHAEYRAYQELYNQIERTVECGRKGQPNLNLEETVKMTLDMLVAQLAAAQTAQQEPAPAEPQAEGYKFCPNCGAPAEGMKFCGNCGNKLV